MKQWTTWTTGVLMALCSAVSFAQSAEAQRDMRSAWYAFGMGYTAALIAQAPQQPDQGRREARSAAGAVVWDAVKGSKSVPVSLVVNRPGEVGYDINVGSATMTDIRRLFGSPTAEKNGRMTYSGEAEICRDHYDFVFKGGLLQAVSWTWCSD